jgi:hypothetical protein
VQSLWNIDLLAVSNWTSRTPFGELLHAATWYSRGTISDVGIAFHSLLDWLVDCGIDMDLSFSLEERDHLFTWEAMNSTGLIRYPSILFPLRRPEFIEGTLEDIMTPELLTM